MDRGFYAFVGAAAVIGFGTVWTATGGGSPPPPPEISAPPVPIESGPANPDAASALTVPVRVDGDSATSPSGPVPPLDPNAAAMQPTPANGSVDTPTVTPSPPAPPPPPVVEAPPPPPAAASSAPPSEAPPAAAS